MDGAASSNSLGSTVFLHLKGKGHCYLNILAREDSWFERGRKEAIHVKLV